MNISPIPVPSFTLPFPVKCSYGQTPGRITPSSEQGMKIYLDKILLLNCKESLIFYVTLSHKLKQEKTSTAMNMAPHGKNRNNYSFSIVGIGLVLIMTIIFSCTINKSDGESRITRTQTKDSPLLNETARFLAGLDITDKSPLHPLTLTGQYQSYKRDVDANWNKLQVSNLEKIEKWKAAHLPGKYSTTIYYPFSGPDILNALAFFPKGSDYIMFGLEPPGDVVQPHKMQQAKVFSGLLGIQKALSEILRVNFFMTREMAKELSNESLSSIGSVMMIFLARYDYEVLEVNRIALDDNAKLVSGTWEIPGSKNTIRGIEIIFRKAGAPLQRARYFQVNVIDYALNTSTNFIPWLQARGRYTTIIKSASYLMHNTDKFTKIRDITLAHSDLILQDDSGIALRYFDPKVWKLTYHGQYTRPIPLFAHRFQKDFYDNMKNNSKGLLPFSYGYDIKPGKEPNLMMAERIMD